ncbi:MAG: 2-hydroxychromene-2-carboxylate isomerase [Hydrogenophaga sp.]|nr:2-hydroxychromene-2-carboxylate isomerase [Hydrogenophaga sp.]
MTEAPRSVDYFFAPMSPWTYLGHARFVRIAREAGASVRVRPMDLGQVFPVSGGLPLPKRAPQRQAYRLVELRRFADWLQLPLNLQPAFFPVKGDASAQLIVAVDQHDGSDAALALTGAVLAACWAQDRDIANPATLAALLQECGLPAERLAQSQTPDVAATCQAHTQAAIDGGVFGAPSYVLDGEIFWGQDRLDFLQHQLGAK